MTRDEAIFVLEHIEAHGSLVIKAKEMAIEALKQEPCGDAISRQTAIETIDSWLSCDDYNEAEREIMRAARSMLLDLPSVNPQEPKWIPVSERLPENRNREVLISLEWGIDIGRYDGEWRSEWINHYDDGDVLAWMPLPAPYEPQESEE